MDPETPFGTLMADVSAGRIDAGRAHREDRLPGDDSQGGRDHGHHPETGRNDERADEHRADIT